MSTVRITFKGTAPVLVPDAGLAFVQPGETVSVKSEVAPAFLCQPQWVKAKEKAEEKAPKA